MTIDTRANVTEALTNPPVAKKVPSERTFFGKTLEDNYGWLRDKENPEVIAYLEAENAYTDAWMKPTAELQKTLYGEMLSHIKETDESVPYRHRDHFYYTRTVEGHEYPIYCRKFQSLDAPEQVILDVNELAKDEPYMAIGALTISDDANLLAYSFDNTGFRQYTLRVKDLSTGEIFADTAERVGSVAWAKDPNAEGARIIFYSVEDEATKRQYRLYRHVLGEPVEKDVLVFEESDERFNIGAGRTSDDAYLILESASHTTSEERFLPADAPNGEWRLIEPRRDNVEYYVDHRDGLFYIRTNDQGRNFRLVTAPVDAPASANWKEMIAHREEVMLEEVDIFQSFYVVEERYDGLPHLRVEPFAGSTVASHAIGFPEPVYSAHGHANREFNTTKYRYTYQSLVTPGSVFEYDTATGSSTLLKEQEVPGGFDRTLYASERVFARAADGVEVPISLVYRKDTKVIGANPIHVYAYGSYGYSLPVGFNGNRLSLLDRGVVLAYAHIRGGGDLGKPWHDAGRLMVKMNTFTDFIAAVEHLVAEGYGDKDRVSIEGGSAGGLLMGAVVNLRPDLFRAVVSHVPFVDVMNTMLDPTLPLTVPEYEEWGNPNEEAAFTYMLGYSPYDNLKSGPYPAMLVKTSLNDSQVMYWEPAKYVAKLRTLKQDSTVLLLHTNMAAGHGGASGRYEYLEEIAFDYAFLLRALEVVDL
jgi:oligopeptidase B